MRRRRRAKMRRRARRRRTASPGGEDSWVEKEKNLFPRVTSKYACNQKKIFNYAPTAAFDKLSYDNPAIEA